MFTAGEVLLVGVKVVVTFSFSRSSSRRILFLSKCVSCSLLPSLSGALRLLLELICGVGVSNVHLGERWVVGMVDQRIIGYNWFR